MKPVISVTSVLAAFVMTLLPVKAQVTYTGSGVADGTIADGNGFNSVVVNNNATSISFTLNTSANMASWIFYAIEIQYVGGPVGDTGLFNPWGPAVGASTGLNALINTYGSGATPLTWSGSWVAGSSVSYAAGGTGTPSATITVPLSSLGLSPGSSFYFDVVSGYTSIANAPYTQAAYGALDNSGYLPESDGLYHPWSPDGHQAFYDSATSSGSSFGMASTMYSVAIPEPTTLALLGGGLVFLMAQRRRNRR